MPDNAIYYQLAYAATAIVYVGYGVSLWLRARRLGRREVRVNERD
jgi:hypothetical protein